VDQIGVASFVSATYLYFVHNPKGGTTMARFKEADERILNKKICMNCYARNAPRATRCRRCGYDHLRPKAKESRKT